MWEKYLKEAYCNLAYAEEEYNSAKEKNDKNLIQNASCKAYLAVVKATYALFLKKGIKEEELPTGLRGQKFFLRKFATKEILQKFFFLRDLLHIEGYYEGNIEIEEFSELIEETKEYIKLIELA